MRGADVNAVNLYGKSAHTLAVKDRHPEAAEFLVQHGARPQPLPA